MPGRKSQKVDRPFGDFGKALRDYMDTDVPDEPAEPAPLTEAPATAEPSDDADHHQ